MSQSTDVINNNALNESSSNNLNSNHSHHSCICSGNSHHSPVDQRRTSRTRTRKVISPIVHRSEPSHVPSPSHSSTGFSNDDVVVRPDLKGDAGEKRKPQEELGKKLFHQIRFGEHSIQGHRGSQEDSVALHKDVPKDLGLEENGFAFFGVFDGHGGDQASEFVSEKLPKYTCEALSSSSSMQVDDDEGSARGLQEALGAAFERVEREYLTISRESDAKDGTTAVVFLIEGNQFVAGNVGDSELVLRATKTGEAIVPFKVHNPSRNPEEERRVREEGGIVVDGRVGHPNLNPQFFSIAVSRAIGDIFFKHPEYTVNKPSGLISTADFFQGQVLPNLDFAILACDGVWDVLDHQEAVDFVYQQLKQKNDPEEAAKALVNLAFERGSQDNITALIISFRDLSMDEKKL